MAEFDFAEATYLRSVLDAIPNRVFVVDGDTVILDANTEAKRLHGDEGVLSLGRFCGDVLDCVHARESEGGCGASAFCPECVIRHAIMKAHSGQSTCRATARMRLQTGRGAKDAWFLVTAAPLPGQKQGLYLLTLEDVTELIELRRLVPMCASCRKVRNDVSYWQEVEEYLQKNTGVRFTHGLCPECVKKLGFDNM